MKSVCERLGTKDFPRVRVGIGKPNGNIDLINYVIGYIDDKTREILNEATTEAKDAVFEILKNGIDAAMNKFN